MPISSSACLILGEGILAETLAGILKSNVLSDEKLRGALVGAFDARLDHCDLVLVLITPDEDSKTLVWRHRVLWRLRELRRINDGLRWVVATLPHRQSVELQEADVLGRSSATAAFSKWEAGGMRFVALSEGLTALLQALSYAAVIPIEAWQAAQRRDETRGIIEQYRRFLGATPSALALPKASRLFRERVPRLMMEHYCPGPNRHAQANEIWRWLSVADNETQQVEEGIRLFSPLIL